MAWKEQMATLSVPDEGLVLEAVWQGGHPRVAVVAPPHPAYGGSLDNPVCSELAYGLYKAGWSSLRFNWRGVGASQGAVSSETGAADADYTAALDHVADTVDGPVLAAPLRPVAHLHAARRGAHLPAGRDHLRKRRKAGFIEQARQIRPLFERQ